MKLLRTRPAASATRDEGMTLVEVMIAMLIFAIVSVGVIYTMLSVMTIGRDSRARQVATNLAAEAVDRAREEGDIFDLLDRTYDVPMNDGEIFTVTRTTAWVSDPAEDFTCGGGGDSLRYKRVNVEVTWENMRAGSTPARSDTIIDPKNRINDPTKGTILISTLNGQGEGNAGVTVTAQRINPTGTTLPAVTTDAQGCAYILRVEPGDYRITISKPGNRDVDQVATPTTTVGVAARSTASVAFTYDQLSTLRLAYLPNVDPVPAVAPNMPTTLVSTYGRHEPSGSGTNPRQFTVFPHGSGYNALPGRYAPYLEPETGPIQGCLSPDPAEWTGGERPARIGTAPGATVDGEAYVGVVELDVGSISNSNQRYVRAVAVASPPSETGDPGCVDTYEFTFPTRTLDASGSAVVALPPGTWELYRGGSTPTTRISHNQITPVTNGSVNGSGSSTTVTMDPRS